MVISIEKGQHYNEPCFYTHNYRPKTLHTLTTLEFKATPEDSWEEENYTKGQDKDDEPQVYVHALSRSDALNAIGIKGEM